MKQKKSLSQIFLKVDWPGKKTAELLKSLNIRSVLEIGPGGGILTQELLAEGLAVTAVETDDRFAELLREKFSEEKFKVIHQDFMMFDLDKWVEETPGPLAVCGNIPYHISSPIILKVMPYLTQLKGSMFLVQLEFAQRLVSKPSSKSYGSLSVYTQLRSKAEIAFKVDRHEFTPVPKVDSALVVMFPREDELSLDTLKKVESVTRLAFLNRRKKLSNGLAPILNKETVADCPVDLNKRPDALTPEEFVALALFLKK
jgi:16S rRNA (adenine1518-N6/adenine1519-N6)-dimethyltransferase